MQLDGLGIVHADYVNHPNTKNLLYNLGRFYAAASKEAEEAASNKNYAAEDVRCLVAKAATYRKIIEYITTDINSIVKQTT